MHPVYSSSSSQRRNRKKHLQTLRLLKLSCLLSVKLTMRIPESFKLMVSKYCTSFITFNFISVCSVLDTPDTLICGRCRQTFANWVEFRDHKKQPCEISSETEPIQIPQMEEINTTELKSNDSEVDPGPLRCFICKCENEFSSWELLKHLSTQHNMTVWFADRKVY